MSRTRKGRADRGKSSRQVRTVLFPGRRHRLTDACFRNAFEMIAARPCTNEGVRRWIRTITPSRTILAGRTPNSSNPMCRQPGVKGAAPLRRRHPVWGTVVNNGCPLCGPSVEDSSHHTAGFAIPRVLVRGDIRHLLPAAGTDSLPGISRRGKPPAARTFHPLHSHRG